METGVQNRMMLRSCTACRQQSQLHVIHIWPRQCHFVCWQDVRCTAQSAVTATGASGMIQS